MVTLAGAYGSHTAPIPYWSEPTGVTEVRSAFDSVMNQVLREFVNQSVQATVLGIRALDAGDYITLDQLEGLITKG